jgi:hypothetical protein
VLLDGQVLFYIRYEVFDHILVLEKFLTWSPVLQRRELGFDHCIRFGTVLNGFICNYKELIVNSGFGIKS